MNYLIWPASLVGILSTAVVFGTDMFFLTVGRPALRLASASAVTEVMGFVHLFADRRMPVPGVLAILSNVVLTVFGAHAHRSIYVVSLSTLILFVVTYDRFSKPINRLQTEAAKTRKQLDNARVLQQAWDRSLLMRVPLLTLSMLAQCFALLSTLAERQC
jgi:hypothetical protein